jgi:hypothetical protein
VIPDSLCAPWTPATTEVQGRSAKAVVLCVGKRAKRQCAVLVAFSRRDPVGKFKRQSHSPQIALQRDARTPDDPPLTMENQVPGRRLTWNYVQTLRNRLFRDGHTSEIRPPIWDTEKAKRNIYLHSNYKVTELADTTSTLRLSCHHL